MGGSVFDSLHADLSGQLLASVESKARAVWADLSELWKVEVKEALEDVANLTLYRFKAVDDAERLVLDMELRHARARLANWTFVGADVVRIAIKDTLKELAELFGSFLRGVIK